MSRRVNGVAVKVDVAIPLSWQVKVGIDGIDILAEGVQQLVILDGDVLDVTIGSLEVNSSAFLVVEVATCPCSIKKIVMDRDTCIIIIKIVTWEDRTNTDSGTGKVILDEVVSHFVTLTTKNTHTSGPPSQFDGVVEVFVVFIHAGVGSTITAGPASQAIVTIPTDV